MIFHMRKYKGTSNYPYHPSWVVDNGKTVHELIESNKYLKDIRNKLIAKRNNKH
jgi:hypothetical protein